MAAEIHKLQKNGVTIYPATTTDAVVDPIKKKNLFNILNDIYKNYSDILLAFNKSDFTDKGYYDINTGELKDNVNTVYKKIDIPENSQTIFYQFGYNPIEGSAVQGWVLFDSEGQKIISGKPSKKFEKLDLTLYENAKSIAFSTPSGTNYPIMNILFSGLNNSDIDDKYLYPFIEDNFKYSAGLYNSSNNSMVSYNEKDARCSRVEVQEGDIMKLTCSSVNDVYCGAYVTDDNDLLVSKLLKGTSVAYIDEEIVIPKNGKYLYVNSYKNQIDINKFSIKRLSNLQEIADLVKSLQNSLISIEDRLEKVEKEDKTDNNILPSEESSLMDAIYELSLSSIFSWKPFNKALFTWTNDDGLQSMIDYMLVCEKHGVPFCPAFPPEFISNTYPLNNDTDQYQIVRDPAYDFEFFYNLSGKKFNRIKIYCDVRTNLIGQSISVTLNLCSGNEIQKTKNALFASLNIGNNYYDIESLSGYDKVGIIISGNTGTASYINISLLNTDSSTKTVEASKVLKRIVFNFGEVLAHGTKVINSYDINEVKQLFKYYCYDGKSILEEAIGDNVVKGLITIGGPNSNRWWHTELGQKYMIRNYLYGDYYGNTPQYKIERSSFSSYGYIQMLKTSLNLSIGTNYRINNIGATLLKIESSDEINTLYFKTIVKDAIDPSGIIYDYQSKDELGSYSDGKYASDDIRKELFLELVEKDIDKAIKDKKWIACYTHEEVSPDWLDGILSIIKNKIDIGESIEISTWNQIYNNYKSWNIANNL